MAMGPLAVGDLAGLDVGWRIRKEYRHLEKPGSRQPLVADRLCEMGRYGQKTGAGWYRYDENRKPIPDPEVQKLIEEVRNRSRHQRADDRARKRSSSERMYALVNEGAKILEEGIALRAVDIDIIYVNGYGFPGLPRRADVVRRHGRTEEGLRSRPRVTSSTASCGSRRRC